MLQEFHLALGICRSFDVGGLNAIVRQVAPPKQTQLVSIQNIEVSGISSPFSSSMIGLIWSQVYIKTGCGTPL